MSVCLCVCVCVDVCLRARVCVCVCVRVLGGLGQEIMLISIDVLMIIDQ